ncbi:MAG: hypothetical protein JSS87_10985 [Acidobacteria bacterium]|nr:hypothetical protein [Acidobacteriota bacterium]
MATQNQMTDDQFEQYALGVLGRELGVDGLARFLRLYRSGKGDYTAERQQWLEGVTIDDIIADIKRIREEDNRQTH